MMLRLIRPIIGFDTPNLSARGFSGPELARISLMLSGVKTDCPSAAQRLQQNRICSKVAAELFFFF